MEPDDGGETLAAVECPPDLLEVEAEAPHRGDLVEPLCLLGPVPPMARTRPRGRREQPDLVVMVKRPHGDASGVGEFAHAPFPVAAADFRFRHRRRTYDLTLREVQERSALTALLIYWTQWLTSPC